MEGSSDHGFRSQIYPDNNICKFIGANVQIGPAPRHESSSEQRVHESWSGIGTDVFVTIP